ncbi:MAG: hypothetical protein EOO20_21095 [Chryseobacterium sp.]|nr:MAG: hypothetical protein EOO20_21095 [Chryseobacterium sp.]
MATKQIHFFAEEDDLRDILKSVEIRNKLEYADAGIFDSADIVSYNSYKIIPKLGAVDSGDWNHNRFYLIYNEGDKIDKRVVPLRSGGVRYAVYQDTNPKTIVFKPGGVYKEGVLVAGSIGTISTHPTSIHLFSEYSKQIKKAFVRVGSFYVGKSAKEKMDSGWRLVTNDKSPKEYDLKKA